jgi:hypothetical protein
MAVAFHWLSMFGWTLWAAADLGDRLLSPKEFLDDLGLEGRCVTFSHGCDTPYRCPTFCLNSWVHCTTPLLQNRKGHRLTRHGAHYLLTKYVKLARLSMPQLNHMRISPHILRHTKAMHLVQSGVPLITIKDILGHADVKSTEIYVQIDLAGL